MKKKKRKAGKRRSNRYKTQWEFCRAVMLTEFGAIVQSKYGELLKEIKDPETHGIPPESWDGIELMKPEGRDYKYYDGMRHGFRVAFDAIKKVVDKWQPTFKLSEHIRKRVEWESTLSETERKALKHIPFFASQFPSHLERKARYELTKEQEKGHRELLKKLLTFIREYGEGLPYLNKAAETLGVSAKRIRECIKHAQDKGTSRGLAIERNKKREYLYLP